VRQAALSELDLPGPIRAAVARFLQELSERAPAAQGVVLYGSVARGTSGPDSDVDLLIEWKGDQRGVRSLLAEIETAIFLDTGVLICSHVVSREDWNAMEGFAFHDNVMREGISVH
jgi:predicted nucleotidyltransferase